MTQFDLHSHSNISDGFLSPEDLLMRAAAQGVEALALTDHDTLAGLDRARVAAAACGVELINGIELSCLWGKIGVHIVGLNVDPDSACLQAGVASQLAVREERAIKIAERLRKQGIPGVLDGARAIAGEAVIGRPHFARYLVESGAVATLSQAFKKYLGTGKAGDVKNMWPNFIDAIEWIHAAGGVAVLAHPAKYGLTRTKLGALVGSFAESGGDALEIISGRQDRAVTDSLVRLAQQRQLHASCGSDFHLPDQPWQELGAFGTMPADCSPVWELWQA